MESKDSTLTINRNAISIVSRARLPHLDGCTKLGKKKELMSRTESTSLRTETSKKVCLTKSKESYRASAGCSKMMARMTSLNTLTNRRERKVSTKISIESLKLFRCYPTFIHKC